MNKLKMKIVGWDAANNSLIVSFCSDTSTKDLDTSETYSFQPTSYTEWLDQPEELIKRIAVSGVYQCKFDDAKEAMKKNKELIDSYKALIGKTYEYEVAELEALDKVDKSQPTITGVDEI